jgi:hypothetical protein
MRLQRDRGLVDSSPVGIAYRLDPDAGVTFVVLHGAVSEDDMRAHQEQLGADPGWPAGSKQLADLSTAHLPPLGTRIAEAFEGSEKTAGLRLAVVATEAFAHARAFERDVKEVGLTEMNVIVFNQVQGACTWLGVEYDHANAVIREIREDLRRPPS